MSAPSSSLYKRSLTPSSSSFSHWDELGDEILHRLQGLASEDVLYLGNADVNSKCDFFFNKDINSNILIPKDTFEAPTELLLAGVFEVGACDFFMTSDAKFNPSGTSMRFEQIKLHCHLIPVQRDSQFRFSASDFSTVVANIHAIEKKISDH